MTACPLTIGVLNLSKRITPDEFRCAIGAFNRQVENDFAPKWFGLRASMAEAENQSALAPYTHQVIVQDEIDDPNALGYHTETTSGVVVSYVAVSPVLDEGGVVLYDPNNPQRAAWSSVLSHEGLEMLVDPFVNGWEAGPPRAEGSMYAREVADPCESTQYTVDVAGTPVAVTDFVLPSWFNLEASGPVDHVGVCPGPFMIASGGYMSVLGPGDRVHEVFGDRRRPWKEKGRRTSLRAPRRKSRLSSPVVAG